MIDKGEIDATVTSFTIHSIEVVMDNFGKNRELPAFLGSISNFRELKIYYTTIEQEMQIAEKTEDGLDFDDSLLAYVAKKLNLNIISFDRDFDGIQGITRLRLRDILA